MKHDVGPVRADRARQAAGAEEGPDPFRLPDEGVRDRRVVEENQPPLAAGDRLEPGLERVDLTRRLGIDLAEEPLAEVGDLRPGNPPTNPFVPTTPICMSPTSSTT